MINKYFQSTCTLILFLFSINLSFSQQNVFSRSEVSTGNFGDGQLPWFYQTSNNSQGDPDNGNTTRNFVKIGHNNNTLMTTNGRFYIVNTLDFEASVTAARIINNNGGGLSASGGIYNGSSATHTFNTPIGIDGPTVQLHTNSNGGLIFTETIFINNNIVEFGNLGTGEIEVSGSMEGSGNVTKVGMNVLTISGTHSYTGTTTINEGVLRLQGSISDSDVIVKSGATLEINGFASANSILVEAGGHLKINSSETLTVTNGINLESISSSYSSLISDGTIIGTVNYSRHVNNAAGQGSSTAANDLISPPLSGMTFGALRTANSNILSGTIGGGPTLYLFGPFDNSSVNDYVLYEQTTDDGIVLDTGIGYRTGSTDNGTYTFTGIVETGSISENITVPTDGSIWNLIGNPYPSYITVDEFLSINNAQFDPSSAGVYGYDGAASDGWIIYNFLTPAGTLIAPGQGFFVASQPGGGIVNFNSNMRSSGISDDFIPMRSSSEVTNIKLSLSNTTENFNTDIYFTEFTSLGLDPGYDASLFGGSAPSFSVYSHLVEDNNDVPFAIQALGKTDYGNVTISIGVNANLGEQLIFKISENTLPSSVSVYLDDNVENTSTELTSSDYVITPITNLNGTGRFYLRFSDTTLSTSETNFEAIDIYTNQDNKTIVIAGQLLEGTIARVFDLQGRLVTQAELNFSELVQTLSVNNLNSGVYVVKLEDTSQIKTQKVIIK